MCPVNPYMTLTAQSETSHNDLLALQWRRPLQNVLVVKKDDSETVDAAVLELARHVQTTYPKVSLIFESETAHQTHAHLSAPIFSCASHESKLLASKVDLTVTLGGDGTILHATSLFAQSPSVPPILSFSMGTLGFLGEWRFADHKRAFREVYMSGAEFGNPSPAIVSASGSNEQWAAVRGKNMGASRRSRVLVRNRLKIGIFDSSGRRIDSLTKGDDMIGVDLFAMNEVLLHRGRAPHLSVISIHVGGRFLTEAVADGMLVSTPTGSTAYSLSSGGSIVHPLVSSLLLTPICPRSLSFRPLVLPANTPISLRLSERNRSAEVDISIDGVRQDNGLKRGMEVRVVGESTRTENGIWTGGVPSVVRAGEGQGDDQDHWVGGLNALLKFNYPFGQDA